MGNQQSQQVRLEERGGQTFDKLLQSQSLRLDPTFHSVLLKDVNELKRQLQHSSRAINKVENNQGFGVAHLCCVLRWSEGLEACLQAGAAVDKASISGYTPLHLACYFGDTECCRILLCHGARRDIRSRRGALAIHFAAQQTCCDVLEIVTDGCSPHNVMGGINSLGCSERTPLQLAVLLHGDPTIVNFLIDAGAKVSQRNQALFGVTPLHTAAHHARVEALRSLLQANADPNITSDRGVLPIQELFLHPHMKHNEEDVRQMLVLLQNAGSRMDCHLPPQGYSLLHLSMMVCNEEETVDLLLSMGLDVSMQTNKLLNLFDPRIKTTMLHKAAKKGWMSVLQKLLLAGADVNLRDGDGLQPLHLAVLHKRTKAIQLLLSWGANPHALACNCYPNFKAWKMRRAMQAVQTLMNNPDGMHQLQHLFEEPAEEVSAVDMAVSISQHIPSVEVFLRHHAMPSKDALCLGEKDTPIMRMIVQRPLWSPELHRKFPAGFRLVVRELLRCLRRATRRAGVHLPDSVIGVIIHKLAYPVSDWADNAWLAAQRIGQVEAEEQVVAEDPAAEPGNQGLPPGFPQFFGAALHQLQQDFVQVMGEMQGQGPGGEDDEGQGLEGEDSDAEGGQPGQQDGPHQGLAGLLGGMPAGFPVPQMVQHHDLGNMQVIQMEFNVAGFPLDLPGMVFHAGPNGFLPMNFNHEDQVDDQEEENEDGEVHDALLGGTEQDGPPVAGQVQQRQQQCHGEGSHQQEWGGEDDISSPSGASTDDDAPGPSTRAGSKRRMGRSDSSQRTDATSSAGKKQKRE